MTRRFTPRTIIATLTATVMTLAPTAPAHADVVRDRQWHLKFLNVAEAHRVSTGKGVTVAVIDTGVDASHPDLTGNVLPGSDFTGKGTDGRTDENGHGTAMAGLIAGHGHGPDNRDGVIGIAPDAKILPIRKAIRLLGNGEATVSGIHWAIEHGADVISISSASSTFAALRQAVQEALDHNIVVVAAAGNRPDDAAIVYPARYPGVIAVGASDRAGRPAKISVTGPEMTILAPGDDITTTNRRHGYETTPGTSNSTAIVAGAAALIRAKYPDASASEVYDRLAGTATDKGPAGHDPKYGYGVLNLVAALTATAVPHIEPSAGATGKPATLSPSTVSLPPVQATPAPLQINPIFYVILVVLLVLGVIVVGLLIWLVTRKRRTRVQ